MEKQWCVYKFIWPAGFGRIVEYGSPGIVWVQYNEEQRYEPWDEKYIERFDKLIEALEFLCRFSPTEPSYRLTNLKEIAEERFPGVLEMEDVKKENENG